MKAQNIFLLASGAFLFSCSGGGSSSGPVAPNQSSATPSGIRAGLAALAAGVYSGDCITAEDTNPMSGSITILSSGAVQAPQVSTNLNNANVTIGYSRNFDLAGAPTDATYTATTPGDNALTLGLVSAASQVDNSAGALMWAGTPGPHTTLNGIRCYNSPQTTSLKAANATSFAMPYIQSPTRTLNCTNGDTRSQITYSLTSFQVRFGNQTIVLSNRLASESVVLSGETQQFSYVADLPDGSEFAVSLDPSGNFAGASLVNSAGETDCLL